MEASSPRREAQLLRECAAAVSMAAGMPPAEEVAGATLHTVGACCTQPRGATIAFDGVSVAIPLARSRKQVAAGAPAERVLLRNITGVIPGGSMYALMVR